MHGFFQRILLASASAILLFTAAQAQEDQSQGKNQPQSQDQTSPSEQQGQGHGRFARRQQQRHMQMLAEKLGLTDQQKQQFQQIQENLWQQGRSIRQDSSLSDDQKREKMQELRKQAHKQMFELLTPEQKEQFKQMRQQHQQQKDKDSSGAGNPASASNKSADDDPFAGMTSDDEPGNPY